MFFFQAKTTFRTETLRQQTLQTIENEKYEGFYPNESSKEFYKLADGYQASELYVTTSDI